MATTGWFVLAGVCLLYIALGLWAVAQIFPTDHDAQPRDPARTTAPDPYKEDSRT